jgi:hypothetical protein
VLPSPSPSPTPTRIAYIVVAHKLPHQLLRLVSRLNTDRTWFFIHIDKKTDALDYQFVADGLRGLSNCQLLPRRVCHWGDFGDVQAAIDGIHEVIRQRIPADYAILLSGQDYPIKSNRHIERFLSDSCGRSYLSYTLLPSPHWENGGLDRLERWHFHLRDGYFVFPEKRRFRRRAPELLWSLAVRFFPVKRKLPRGFKWFGGSAFWCLTRDCIEYIDSFVRENRHFVKFFRYALLPDEIFFQTVLVNSRLKNTIVNDHLRYIDWTKPNSPAILRKEDFDYLMQSSRLFARKFDDSVDAEVLDMIDCEIERAEVRE